MDVLVPRIALRERLDGADEELLRVLRGACAVDAFRGAEAEVRGFGRERRFRGLVQVLPEMPLGLDVVAEAEVADAEAVMRLGHVLARGRARRLQHRLVRRNRFLEALLAREVLGRDPLGRRVRAEDRARILHRRERRLANALRPHGPELRELAREVRGLAADGAAFAGRGGERLEAEELPLIHDVGRQARRARVVDQFLRLVERRPGLAGADPHLGECQARGPVERAFLALFEDRLEVADRFLELAELALRERAPEEALVAELRILRVNELGESFDGFPEASLVRLLVFRVEHRVAVIEPAELAGRREREAAVELPPRLVVEHLGVAVLGDDVGLRAVDAPLVVVVEALEQRQQRRRQTGRTGTRVLGARANPLVVAVRDVDREFAERADQLLFLGLAQPSRYGPIHLGRQIAE